VVAAADLGKGWWDSPRWPRHSKINATGQPQPHQALTRNNGHPRGCPRLSVCVPTIGDMFGEEILKRQSGVIARQQALAEGMSNSAIKRTIKAGTWEPVLPRVFVASNYELTDQAWTRAIALWAGERATVSGLDAVLRAIAVAGLVRLRWTTGPGSGAGN
jgi:hypothetical protein